MSAKVTLSVERLLWVLAQTGMAEGNLSGLIKNLIAPSASKGEVIFATDPRNESFVSVSVKKSLPSGRVAHTSLRFAPPEGTLEYMPHVYRGEERFGEIEADQSLFLFALVYGFDEFKNYASIYDQQYNFGPGRMELVRGAVILYQCQQQRGLAAVNKCEKTAQKPIREILTARRAREAALQAQFAKDRGH